MPFTSETPHALPAIDFTLSDYLTLLDTTGRILREDKPGRILDHHEPILSRLNLTPHGWLTIVNNLETQFCYVLGNSSKFNDFAKNHRIRPPMGKKLATHCYR
jgi:hypothetical protein